MKILLLAFVLAAPLSASDLYIDANIGSDETGDGSAANPWKTITYGLSQAVDWDVLVLGAGTYDEPLGESFPLVIPTTISVRGAGMGLTIIDGDGANELVKCDGTFTDPPVETSLSHVTLTDAIYALTMTGNAGYIWTMRGEDIEFLDVFLAADAGGSFVFQDIELYRCRILGGEGGIGAGAIFDGQGLVGFHDGLIEDVEVAAGAGGGLGGSGTIGIYNSTIRNCDLGLATGEGGYAALERTLITGCKEGILLQDKETRVDLDRCTVTGNEYGLAAYGVHPEWERAILENSIVRGNTVDDITTFGLKLTATHCNTRPLLPGEGNMSQTSGFVAPALGDFRLRDDSVLIDAGDPEAAPGGVDADGDPLLLDGDLDGFARADIGYDEFNAVRLTADETVAAGGSAAFSVTAPPGWTTCLAGGLLSADLSLGALGSLLVDPVSSVPLGCSTAPWSGSIPVPAGTSLSGVPIYLQAFAWSPALSPGSVSNRRSVALQ